MLFRSGVVLIVWHKIDMREITTASLTAVCVSLLGATVGTLYQRAFCPRVDLRSAGLIQFVASLLLLAPLAWSVEGFAVQWTWQVVAAMTFLVIGASLLAVEPTDEDLESVYAYLTERARGVRR
mgnify:CR=1 FL=1